MKRANRLMLLFGVVLAAVSFVAVLGFGSFGQQPQQPADPDVQVVVAAQNLAIGTALAPDMLATASMPQSQATNTYGSPNDIAGLVIRRAVAQGQALKIQDFQSAVTVPDLVAAIQPGMRAMAVPLNRVDSVGMLLQPGDWVDVVLTIDDRDGLNPVSIPNPGASPGVDRSVRGHRRVRQQHDGQGRGPERPGSGGDASISRNPIQRQAAQPVPPPRPAPT